MPLDSNGGRTLETVLVNIGVGIAAAAIGVWGGVRVHGAQIEEIQRRLDRIEVKIDGIIQREIEDR
jgi:hypothetical protein